MGAEEIVFSSKITDKGDRTYEQCPPAIDNDDSRANSGSTKNALKVLGETGVRVDSPAILQMLELKLGLKSQDRIIKFPTEIVEDAIKSAPKTIDVYDRRGEHKLKLGEDRLRFG